MKTQREKIQMEGQVPNYQYLLRLAFDNLSDQIKKEATSTTMHLFHSEITYELWNDSW